MNTAPPAVGIRYGLPPAKSGGSNTMTLVTAPEPKFELPLSSLIELDGEEMLVDRKLGDKWLFINPATKNSEWKTDREIAELQAQRLFRVLKTDRNDTGGSKPRSPLVVGLNEKGNLRKHAYVEACLNAPDGFRRSRPLLVPIIQALAAERGEEAPGFSTVIEWVGEYEKHFHAYGTACFTDRHDLKGKHGHKLLPFQEKALTLGVNRCLSGMTTVIAYAAVCRYVQLYDAKFGQHLNKAALRAEVRR